MELEELFRAAVAEFGKSSDSYALAGGLIASLYRSEKRLTQDIDFIVTSSDETFITRFFNRMNLDVAEVQQAQLKGGHKHLIRSKSTPICIYVGRSSSKEHPYGIDLLLNQFCWSGEAIKRAELNRIDFGFASVPALTVEDVILSKLDALRDNPLRYKDLDDLQSIFRAKHELDIAYLSKCMLQYQLSLPKDLRREAHYMLGRVSKKIVK